MYSMNSHRSLEDSIYRVLKQNKCPLRVYKDIWLYIPHTKNPAINDFHKEIQTKVLEYNEQKLILSNAINRCNISSEKIQSILDFAGGYKGIVKIVSRMNRDREYHRKVRKYNHFPIGHYVKIREILRRENLLI